MKILQPRGKLLVLCEVSGMLVNAVTKFQDSELFICDTESFIC